MTDIVKGMARAICRAIWDHDYTPRDPLHPDARWLQAMKAAKAGADFLADNVSDDVVEAAAGRLPHFAKVADEDVRDAIAAAIRAAAGEEKQ